MNGGRMNTYGGRDILFGGSTNVCISPILTAIRTKCCLRTNKSAAKRFRVMGNGRIKRYVCFSFLVLFVLDVYVWCLGMVICDLM